MPVTIARGRGANLPNTACNEDRTVGLPGYILADGSNPLPATTVLMSLP
ncbi:MAG: hypothetical protein J7460_15505 [Chloroflexus sp.]|nr:hypothetical protein [Chloroflexus sp.]